MVFNESVFLPIWLNYYGPLFGYENLYVIDDGSSDGSTDDPRIVNLLKQKKTLFDETDRAKFVSAFHAEILRFYDVVIYTDVDELIIVDPKIEMSLPVYLASGDFAVKSPTGWNILHCVGKEGSLDLSRPLFEQRRFVQCDLDYFKPVISRVPLQWGAGFHFSNPGAAYDQNVLLFHLRAMDRDISRKRIETLNGVQPSPNMLRQGHSSQWRLTPEHYTELYFPAPEREFDVVHDDLAFINPTLESPDIEQIRLLHFRRQRKFTYEGIALIPDRFKNLIHLNLQTSGTRAREVGAQLIASEKMVKIFAKSQDVARLTTDAQRQSEYRQYETRGGIAYLWQRLRQSPMQGNAWLSLARAYETADLRWQAGYAARQAQRLDSTLEAQFDALGIGPWRDATVGDGLLGRAELAHAGELAGRFAACVADLPGDWLTWLYLARLQELAPSPTPAGAVSVLPSVAVALQQAKRLEFLPGETQHLLGVWRLNAGDAKGAVAAFSDLLGLRPQRHGSMMYLGEALLRIGNVAAAEKAFERAAQSANPGLLVSLANRVYTHNYWQEAIAILRRAIELRPADVATLLVLARIQHEAYALVDCQVTLARIAELAPEHPEARLLEAGMLGRMGDAKGHLATLQRAYEAGGDPRSRLASSIAMTALYHDALPAGEVAALHRDLCAPIEAGLTPRTSFLNNRDRNRRLRVGFVTGDLHRQHPVNLFLLPMLSRFDRAQVEICIYFTGTMHDAYTRQAEMHADRWRDTSQLDDDAIQSRIIGDEVDILIDLAGHTSSHRLGVFAKRAAPVQATFLGYPHSTGLSQMDWLIGDAVVSPAEHGSLFSEGIAQLPHSVFCWAPVDDYPLPFARADTDPVVFASFNNAMKLSPRTIGLWSEVLRAVPQAFLLLKAPSLRDPGVQERFAGLFVAQGIARERLLFRGPSGLAEMMQEYGAVDIALDPTPYNGGTTTLQALWMGVPVVTLAGSNFVSRMGASFLSSLDRGAWIAADDAGYVAAAARLAGDISGLRRGRAALRSRMAASPLCDIGGHVADFTALVRRMWTHYCAGDPVRLICAGGSGPAITQPATGLAKDIERHDAST